MAQTDLAGAKLDSATQRSSQPKLKVISHKIVASDVVELTLASPAGDRLPDWTPGSHIDLVLPTGATRQYSLCGDRWDSYSYRVAIRREEYGRGGSEFIHREISAGSTLVTGGPRNNFRLVPSERYVFVAGGIGITAIIPMIHAAKKLNATWNLVYLGRSRKSMAYIDELEGFGEAVSILPKDECGSSDLSALIGPMRPETTIYACGPQRMLDELENHCAAWPDGSLRLEHFAAKDQGEPARKEPFQINLAQSNMELTVEPDSSVMDVMQEAGVSILSSCKTGICGTCEVKVLGGIPDHRDSILTEAERSSGDTMFPCVSRSFGDYLTLDI